MSHTHVRAQAILKKRRALPFFSQHPWVFAGAIARTTVPNSPSENSPENFASDGKRENLAPGSIVDLYSHEREFIARGLYNPHSNIKLRLYSWDEAIEFDEPFWGERIQSAILKRRQFSDLDSSDAACRLIYSEADRLSGLIVDRYGEWLLVQFTSLALTAAYKDVILKQLQEQLQPKGIWLRTEKGIKKAEGLELPDGLLAGEPPPQPIIIREGALTFEVDVVQGQKTGFFLDQRENRAVLGQLLSRKPGQRVLDLFCYSGGFGLAAAVNGQASEVVAVDVSETAIALAQTNAERNGVANRFQFRTEKVFTALEALLAAGERFDTIIVDPPKMTRHRSGLVNALRGYHSLNAMAVGLLNPGGTLITCSCSGLISQEEFEQLLTDVALSAGRPLSILESRGASADHPTSVFCPETRYLKCCICAVD